MEERRKIAEYLVQSLHRLQILRFLVTLEEKFSSIPDLDAFYQQHVSGVAYFNVSSLKSQALVQNQWTEQQVEEFLLHLEGIKIIQKDEENLDRYVVLMQRYPPRLTDLTRSLKEKNPRTIKKALSQLINFSVPGIYATSLVTEMNKQFRVTKEGMRIYKEIIEPLVENVDRFAELIREIRPLKASLRQTKQKLLQNASTVRHYLREIHEQLSRRSEHEQAFHQLKAEIARQKAVLDVDELTQLYEDFLMHKKKLLLCSILQPYEETFKNDEEVIKRLLGEVAMLEGELIELEMKLTSITFEKDSFNIILDVEELLYGSDEKGDAAESGGNESRSIPERIAELELESDRLSKKIQEHILQLNLARSEILR